MAASIPFTPRILIDIESLVVGETEAWIDVVRIEHDRLRKLKDILVEEWHLDIGMSIVEVDCALKISACDRHADARLEVICDVTFEIVEQDEELAVRWGKDEALGIKINYCRAGILQCLEGRFDCF